MQVTSDVTHSTPASMPVTDVRAEKTTSEKTRQCIATGQKADPRTMLRFVAGPDGMLVPDLSARLPGRGVWVMPSLGALQKAVSRNLFARALGAPVKIAPDLIETVTALLRQRCLQSLGLVRRAGELVMGYEKVVHALQERKAAGLMLACDASAQTAGEIRAKHGQYAPRMPFIRNFNRDELSLALGRSNVVHAALVQGAMASTFLREFARFEALTPENTAPSTDGAPDNANERSL